MRSAWRLWHKMKSVHEQVFLVTKCCVIAAAALYRCIRKTVLRRKETLKMFLRALKNNSWFGDFYV